MAEGKKRVLALFDVDGTLSPARLTATDEMKALLKELREKIYIGVVGGSDLPKQQEQLGANALQMFDSSSVVEYLGEERYKKLTNFILHYIADLDLPIKRGTFIELRTGLINVSPIGRNCSREERMAYEKFDIEHNVRKNFVAVLEKEFADYKMRFSIGGQISFDVFPLGWDKTYCLQHVEAEKFEEIHFFGDKTLEGQNDYEIYNDSRTIGHAVNSPDDTMRIVRDLWFKK